MNARLAHHLATTLIFAALSGAAACTVNPEQAATPKPGAGGTADGGTASSPDGGVSTKTKPKKQPTTSKLTGLAKSTPPAGATSQGTKSSPTAGGSTIPIVDVEVYLVTIDIDDDGVDDNLYWAHTEDGMTYLWAEGPVTCADRLSDGSGGFLAALAPDGSGAYLFALDECPEQNLFGCSFDTDGVETSCGACAWNEETIVCVAN